jgi:hypothetical protein
MASFVKLLALKGGTQADLYRARHSAILDEVDDWKHKLSGMFQIRKTPAQKKAQ